MPSGFKTGIVNTKERLVSTDHNRMQAFAASDLASIMYEAFGKRDTYDDWYPGVEYEPAAGATPPFATVLRGLRAYPFNGSTDLLVTPGTLLVENPAPGPDDGKFSYVKDPGVTGLGVLQLTPTPGAIRIDVLECQLVDTVLETDNRDIYNTVTGLFAPALVNKVRANRLTYRLRLGTPGAGFPGLVAGWTPLMVAKVPAAAANWDTCELWDVRPLASDLWNAPFACGRMDPTLDFEYLSACETNLAGTYDILMTGHLQGRYEANRVDGFAANNPTSSLSVDITKTAENQAAGFAPVAHLPWYLYLAFPYNMPWRKYIGSATSPRIPAGLRGIPVVTQVAPGKNYIPLAPVPLPTATGLGGWTTYAMVVAAGWVDGSPKLRGFLSDGHWTVLTPNWFGVAATTSDPLGVGSSTYTLVDNVNHPYCAKALRLIFELSLTCAALGASAAASLDPRISIRDPTGVYELAGTDLGAMTRMAKVGDTAVTFLFEVDVPLHYAAAAGSRRFSIVWNIHTDITFTGVAFDTIGVAGWKLTG